jgi:uncharacterized protein YggE
MSYQNENKKTKIALVAGILAIGLLAATLFGSLSVANRASAQTDLQLPGTNSTSKPTVSTAGTATTDVKPDKVSVTVGVETNGTTAEEAATKNADLMEQVIAALKELGISDEQIATSSYSVYPVYSYKDMVNACRVMEGYPIPPECYVEQEITGYKAVNSVTVTLDVEGDVDASEVIDAAIGAGANNVNGVYFFVSQELQQEVRDSLIKEAIDNARHTADIAADAVGHSVSGVQSINLSDVNFPPMFYDRSFFSEAAVSTPLLPGEQEVSMTVNVSFYMTDILA